MVFIPVIRAIIFITIYLPTPNEWKADLTTLVDP